MTAQAKSEPIILDVVEFASAVVEHRRAALNVTVDQVREMAAAVLVFDQQLDDATRRMTAMLLAQPAPERVLVPFVTGGSEALTGALKELAQARWHLDQERHSAGENAARQKFERAAIAVCDLVNPTKKRT